MILRKWFPVVIIGIFFADEDYMMERAMERQLFYELDNFTKKPGLSIVLPVVLLFKFEYEIRDLFTILEGIKYHANNISELLIRDLRRGAIIGYKKN